jgi:hypothetical protein
VFSEFVCSLAWKYSIFCSSVSVEEEIQSAANAK